MKFIWVLLLVFSTTLVHSQSFEVESFFNDTIKNGIIKGVVLDNEANNEPLVFATVLIKGSTLTTTTSFDGSFSLPVKPGTYTLVFSFIGYETIEIPNIVVTPNNATLQNQTLLALNLKTDISSVN